MRGLCRKKTAGESSEAMAGDVAGEKRCDLRVSGGRKKALILGAELLGECPKFPTQRLGVGAELLKSATAYSSLIN